MCRWVYMGKLTIKIVRILTKLNSNLTAMSEWTVVCHIGEFLYTSQVAR